MNLKHAVWVEKYRPSKINDIILPERIKKIFRGYAESGIVEAGLLLSGNPGVGKTTIAIALLEEIGAEYIFLNASMAGNIDTLRTDIQDFAVSMSLDGGRKYVIFDEGDRLTKATQDALRGFIEEFSGTTTFIITCNDKAALSDALHSRFATTDFALSSNEISELKQQVYKRIIGILKNESVEFDREVVADLVNKYFPDTRKLINTLQHIAKSGAITAETVSNRLEDNFDALMLMLKNKKWKDAKDWVAENSSIPVNEIFRKVYVSADKYVKDHTIPLLILHIGKYQYQAAFVTDPEVNLMSFFIEVMTDCEFL